MSPLLAASDSAESLLKLDVEHLLLPVLIQLIVIIAAARAFGCLARRVGQPSVVGEIIAGLLLGPSLLGWLFRKHLRWCSVRSWRVSRNRWRWQPPC
jgi:hypothetical protein